VSDLRPTRQAAADASKPEYAVLTFDAEHPNRSHQHADVPAAVLDLLAERSIRATFFIQGRWAAAHPGLAKRIAAEGHSIGSHSNSHLPMTRLSDDGLVAEVLQAQQVIHEMTGVDPRPNFRCPYGDGHDDPRVFGTLSRLGYRVVGWDVDPEDWNGGRSSADIASHVTGQLGRDWGSPPTVLLHSWPSTTPAALSQILDAQLELGATWVGLDDARMGLNRTPMSHKRGPHGANRP
jgi:peptidoglycan/xylan/chitin deacetylase (PgdA/CDA1 family)